MKNIISTNNAPAAIGPYSQAVEVNGMVFTPGGHRGSGRAGYGKCEEPS